MPITAGLTGTYLIISLIFSSIGLGYFIYGKKQKHKVAFYTGIGLMGFPYVVSDPVFMVVIGLVLMLVPKYLRP